MISKKVNSVQEWLPVDEILENGIIKVKNKNYISRALYEANKEFGKDVDTDELVDDMLRIKETMNTELPFRMFDLTELPGNAVQGVKLLSGEAGYLTDAEKTRKQIFLIL